MLFQSTSLSATGQVWGAQYRLRINISKIQHNPQMQRRSRSSGKVLLKSNQGEREVEALVKDNLGPDKEELALLQQLGVDKIDWNTLMDLFSSIQYHSQNEKFVQRYSIRLERALMMTLSVTISYTTWLPLTDSLHVQVH